MPKKKQNIYTKYIEVCDYVYKKKLTKKELNWVVKELKSDDVGLYSRGEIYKDASKSMFRRD